MKGARWVIVGLLWLSLSPLCQFLLQQHQQLEPRKSFLRYQDMLLDLLGEGRTMLARLLWFKMDLMHEQQDDQEVATFKQKEVVPLLRMINFLDPHLTDAYDTLAFELFKGFGQLPEAIEIVDEGLKYSPDVFDLNFRRSFLAEKEDDWPKALEHAQKAFYAAKEVDQQCMALRCIYRSALHLNDPALGVKVIDHLTLLLGAQPYKEQYARWKQELSRP